MDPDDLETDPGTTAMDLSAKVREAVLSGNASAAMEWAAALDSATSAWSTAKEEA